MDSQRQERRGTPTGKGTVMLPNGSAIGNPPHVPTDENRANVRAWVKLATPEAIAAYMEISRSTLDKHYKKELREGRFELVAKLGSKAIKMALDGHPTMLIFVLRSLGGWTQKFSVTGPGGGPIQTIDLSRVLGNFSNEQLALLEPILEQIVTAGSDNFDFRDIIDAPASPSRETAPRA